MTGRENDAWNEGYEAYMRHEPTFNPYPDSPLAMFWDWGYDFAHESEMETNEA